MNLSLAGGRSFFSYMYEYYFNIMIKYGGIPVVAAGNNYIDACAYAPAWTQYAITVGASDSNYEVKFDTFDIVCCYLVLMYLSPLSLSML